MKTLTACAVVLVCMSLAQAQDAVSRQVTGRGATRELAVKNALYEAVSQVQGVVVSSGLAESGVVVGNLDVTRQEVKKSVELEGVSVRGINTITLTQAEGLIKSYEVLSESQIDADTYEVTLEAWVYDYSSPLADQKTPLAVADFEVEQQVCPFGDLMLPAADVARQFADILTGQLRAAGKFTLLDREYAQAFANEKNLWKSEDGDLLEKSKVGNVQGAEFLLAGRLRRVGIYLEPKSMPATGHVVNDYEGHFVAEVRLFVAATRQIAYTGRYRLRLEDNDVRNLVDKWEIEKIDYDELKDKLLELGARRIVEDIMEEFYPVRVAVVQPNLLILDQGAGRLAEGDLYNVIGEGQEVRDPQTDELLGTAEKTIATVRIRQALPRFAYAEFLKGRPKAVAVGQTCRYIRPEFDIDPPAATMGRKDTTEKTPSGGVKLPFDK